MKAGKCFWTAVFGLALCVSVSRAQQTDPRVNPPVPPQGPVSPGERSQAPKQGGEGEPVPPLVVPTQDARPLSGVELFTLGEMGKKRSYLLPSFEFLESADTNGDITSGQSNFDAVTSLFGRISLQRVWSRYQLTADYSGGGYVYNTRSGSNSAIHQFGLAQRIDWRRWSLLLSDRFAYLPEASFGFGGYSGLAGLGANVLNLNPVFGTDLNPIFEPSQTILTARAQRISNAVIGEVDFRINPKSSITASGSYGILRSPGFGFIDSSNAVFLTGYNYALTHKDTLALTYGLSLFRFAGTNERIHNHSAHVAYGRRLTGRLALQLSAGPEISTFTNGVAGSGNRVSWGMQSSLTYQFRRTSLGGSYANYLTSGSGVLTGAQTHQVQVTVNRQLTRVWSGTLDLGFVHNAALPEFTTGTFIPAFNSEYGGVTVSRPLGRYMNLLMTYYLQRQSSNTGPCTTSFCGTVPLRHHFGLGFNWHHRPILID